MPKEEMDILEVDVSLCGVERNLMRFSTYVPMMDVEDMPLLMHGNVTRVPHP